MQKDIFHKFPKILSVGILIACVAAIIVFYLGIISAFNITKDKLGDAFPNLSKEKTATKMWFTKTPSGSVSKIVAVSYSGTYSHLGKSSQIKLILYPNGEDDIGHGTVGGSIEGDCIGAIYGSYFKGEIVGKAGGDCFISGKELGASADFQGVIKNINNKIVVDITFQGKAGSYTLNDSVSFK